MDEADRMPCPPDFIAAPALVALGAIIGARCAIKPKAKDDWLIVPNLWGGIVGLPSAINLLAATMYRVGELARMLEGAEPGSVEWVRVNRQFNQAARLAQSLAVEFGLTPASATRVAVPERPQGNRFAIFGQDDGADR